MKIKFLKDSPNGDYKAKDVANISDWRANYWVKTGVATLEVDKPKTAKKENKNGAPKNTEKK